MIYAILLAIWASVALTIYWVEITRLPLKIRIRKPYRVPLIGTKDGSDPRYWYPFNRKPFNCSACLPFWLFASFLPIAIYMWGVVAFIAAACSSGIITVFLIKQLQK